MAPLFVGRPNQPRSDRRDSHGGPLNPVIHAQIVLQESGTEPAARWLRLGFEKFEYVRYKPIFVASE